jgi:hypothetical protein
MINLHQELTAIVRALDGRGIPYAVCGGLAMAAYGHARATLDIDLLVPEERLDGARACLRELGYTNESGWSPLARGSVRLFRVVKLDAEAGDFLIVDLLVAAGDLADAWNGRQRRETQFGPIWFVSRSALTSMKRARGSRQDLADIEKLEGVEDEN